MRTIAIKLKTYAPSVKIINNNLRETILRAMLFSLAGLALVYILLMGNTIFNIVSRKAFESRANAMTSQVGALELQYLSMSNKIDLAFAKSIGFQETKTKFATRKSLGSLSMAKNEL